MRYVAVLDVSSFIWDETDYNKNEDKYYVMMDRMLNLQDNLIHNKAYVLLRYELYTQIMVEFPYAIVSTKFSDFTYRTLKFFTDLGERMELYPAHEFSITSNPNLIRKHFNGNTTTEVQYLINRIHTQPQPDIKFFTYEYLWSGGNLKTSHTDGSIEHETLVADNVSYLNKFFLRYKPTFEHSAKHDKYNSGEFISALSSYNERSNDRSYVQSLIDTARQSGINYYNYDLVNDVWVVFRPTRENIYHGHDEGNVNNIPADVRRHFSK